MNKLELGIWKYVNRRQTSGQEILQNFKELSAITGAIASAVEKTVVKYFVVKEIRRLINKKLQWRLDHEERIREFKKRRRWSAI
jgi:hypothetical protein